MAKQVKKQCSRHGCRNDAASLRSRFCTSCFKKNAVAAGKRGGLLRRFGALSLVAVKKWKKKTCMYGFQKKFSRLGCRNDVQGSGRARFCPACVHKAQSVSAKRSALLRALKNGNAKRSALLRAMQKVKKGKKKCSRHGCRNDAASLRALFCKACFKKNAAALGKLTGIRQNFPKTCSRHGSRNDVQGSRLARLLPACFKKNYGKFRKVAGKRCALFSPQAAPWALVLEKFLKYRGNRLLNTKQAGKDHVVFT